LDELGEALAVLLVTVAELVDQVVADDSDVAAYARARVMQVHAGVIGQLREAALVAADSAWEDLLTAASAPPIVGG
jgi:hypothetical protein